MRTRVIAVLTASATLVGLGLTASPAAAATPYQVTLSAHKSHIDYGQRLTLSGRVTGGPVKGRGVTVYWTRASEDDSWHAIRKVSLSKSGRYRTTYKPRFGGDIRFLAVKSKTGKHQGGAGQSDVVAVYQWQSIWRYFNNGLDVDPGPGGATARKGPATVGDTAYTGALLINDEASVGFSTFQCDALRGLAGVASTSTSSGGTLGVSQGGTTFTSLGLKRGFAAVSYGTPLDDDAGVTLDAAFDGVSGGTDDTMVLAKPQVKCDAPAH